jgi:2-dehydro-3-deoxyphosphogluconate aldolase/(4S)-4-hydroxy-2-oxoglutarate aldolase
MATMDELMRRSPVIPVLTVHHVADAHPLAEALVAGGLPVLEVTLRTPTALDVIREMTQVPGAVVGAGTVLNERDLDAAMAAGAAFAVSPGLTESLAKAALARNLPFLPGISTASDIMRGLDLGLDRFKFFPAVPSGGIPVLKALAGPFHQCRFCPTGGITADTAAQWLALDAVLCVGGSWLVNSGPLDTAAIKERARAAADLRVI